MEITTQDGTVHALTNEFIQRSDLLKHMPPGKVSVPFDNETIQSLIGSVFPSDGQKLLNVARAADFLQMDDELDRACRLVADNLRSKTPMEIKKFLNL